MNVLGLCAGIGGLELGLHLAEPRANPIVFIEQDEFCQSILQRRWPGALIWDNVLTFDGRPWRRCIDVFTAGFPCQPWSLAGLGLGVEDERWIFPQIGELIRQVEPEFVFLENVPALIAGGGLAIVLGTLADLGYDAVWGVFICEQLGAAHKRQRVFILGHARSRKLQGGGKQQPRPLPGRQGLANSEGLQCGQGGPPAAERSRGPLCFGQGVADSMCEHLRRESIGGTGWGTLWERKHETGRRGPVLADGDGERLSVGQEQHKPQFETTFGSSRALWAPGPGADWGAIPRELWPSEQPVRGMVDGLPARVELSRRDRVKALGNAVSPPVGAVAWRVLKARLKI